MMHMVRNALDHGIETPAEREAHGKPGTAKLFLRAHHQAGQVVIEIADDGRGLDRQRILAKAVERGLVASGEGLSDNDIYNLIFQPGFSTAAQVTNVSGRGVGMDVVRRHVEKLRGRIEIRSTLGARAPPFSSNCPSPWRSSTGWWSASGASGTSCPFCRPRDVPSRRGHRLDGPAALAKWRWCADR